MATTVVDVVMPQMGVSVSEGTILKWLKQVGETIAADEPLLEISTDKVDTEVPSPGSGVIREILVQEGETVDVGTRLAVIAPEGAEVAAETAPEPEPAPTAEAPPPAAPAAPAAATPAPSPAAAGNGGGERTFVSPVVARIAAEHGVDVGQVAGTGAGGRRDEEGHPRVRRIGRRCASCCRSCGGASREPLPSQHRKLRPRQRLQPHLHRRHRLRSQPPRRRHQQQPLHRRPPSAGRPSSR